MPASAGSGEPLVQVSESQVCCNDEWEAAYRRFQTPEEEVQKVKARLRWANVEAWDRDTRIAELFCGRGSSLLAWEQMGFRQLSGVDLSARLLSEYDGCAKCYVADCRQLPFEDNSLDVAIVQGGLHHLPTLPDDLIQVVLEVKRVLVPEGTFLVFEPWRTPFLDFVRWTCKSRLARASWPRLDALATMIEHELETYEQWLSQPADILRVLDEHFDCRKRSINLGRIRSVLVKRLEPESDRAEAH